MDRSDMCPLCGSPLEGMVFEIPSVSSHYGSRCLNCGHATCNYGLDERDAFEERFPSLLHLHLHVEKHLRPLVQWTPKGSGLRPWKANRRPWWPQGGTFHSEGRTIIIQPERRESRLLWRRFDFGPGGVPLQPAGAFLPFVNYPRFRLALTTSTGVHDAIIRIQADPPKLTLLSAGRRPAS